MECRLLFRESVALEWRMNSKRVKELPEVQISLARGQSSRGSRSWPTASRAANAINTSCSTSYRSVRRVNRYETSASSCSNGTIKCNDLIPPRWISLKHLGLIFLTREHFLVSWPFRGIRSYKIVPLHNIFVTSHYFLLNLHFTWSFSYYLLPFGFYRGRSLCTSES